MRHDQYQVSPPTTTLLLLVQSSHDFGVVSPACGCPYRTREATLAIGTASLRLVHSSSGAPDTPGRSEQRPGLTSDAGLGALVFVEPVSPRRPRGVAHGSAVTPGVGCSGVVPGRCGPAA